MKEETPCHRGGSLLLHPIPRRIFLRTWGWDSNPSGRAMFLNDLHAAVCSSFQFVSTLVLRNRARFDRLVLLMTLVATTRLFD
jgi:hypothetical protein